MFANEKIDATEGQFLKRVLSYSFCRIFDRSLPNIGYEAKDPYEIITEHVKIQKVKDALYLHLDSGLSKSMSQLDSDFGEDIPIGSLMTDKSNMLTVDSDTKLDQVFLSKVISMANQLSSNEA